MGKGRDKRRKQKGSSVAGQGASKTLRKTSKNEEKNERRLDRRLEQDEEDVDALLEKFRLEDERAAKSTIEDNSDPPSVRVHATYTTIPTEVMKDGIVMVFGGEYEDQREHRVRTYNDLYKFNTDKQKWTKISAPNGPSPRSSHQTVYYKNALYVFGGEFTSPKQDRFKHFKDLWRFDLVENSWEKYEIKKGPTARSGHRAVTYHNRMIIFGGFNDAGNEAVYYNDLWVFHFDELRWETVGDPKAQRPSKRGGFRMVVHMDTAYVYGGYSKFRDDEDKDIEHGKTVDDMWKLNLRNYKWEKVQKAGIHPGLRSGFNMCLHHRRAVFFGGATDNEAKKGESIVSDFHNDLFQFNFERQKWYTVALRPSRTTKTDQLPGKLMKNYPSHLADANFSYCLVDEATVAMLAEEEERLRQHKAAIKIQARCISRAISEEKPDRICRYRGYAVRKAYKVYKLGGDATELLYSPATYGYDATALNAPKPRGRISCGLCVVKNDLWLFGGVVEILDKEITLDDVWRLSLKNYDGWHCIKQNSVGEEVFREALQSADSATESEEEEGQEMELDDS